MEGPLTLAGGYALAQFQADVVALGTAYDDARRDDAAVGFARSERTKTLNAIYERMKQFRALVPSLLPANSPARQNLPRLTPAPGTTPPRLAVTGAWDATISNARLTWPAAVAKDVSKLQVRGCTGAYKNDEEEVVADLAADATHWEGDWGLTAPGATASFKVYVMTTTGNENGGKAVKIVRPTT